MNPVPFFEIIRDDLAQVEDVLRRATMLDFPLLGSVLAPIIQSGGKRLRPALVILSARLGTYDQAKILPVSASVEVLHTATLVHDDLVDSSLLRRGMPTLNARLDSRVVVLVGDYLFAKSAELAAEPQNTEINTIFARTLDVICRGELSQLFGSPGWRLTYDEYLQKIYSKTASLFVAATEAGAILSGAAPQQRQALSDYGRYLGIAFQIADDILDFVGSEQELGKPVGSDLRQGTVTLPIIRFLEQHPVPNPVRDYLEQGRKSANQQISKAQEGLQRALEAVRSSTAIDQAYSEAHAFAQQAQETLTIFPDGPYRQTLLTLADYVVQRRK